MTRHRLTLHLPDADATAALARRIAPTLVAGDIIALGGPIGAGKSHFARAAIQGRLAARGLWDEVPSPTFTLVQTYEADDLEIWHCDLYRLGGPEEVAELGLETAFDSAACLIEWPDRLGDALPDRALRLDLVPAAEGDSRDARLDWTGHGWTERLAPLGDLDRAP